MDTLLKQMQERLSNLESQEQTDETKIRKDELCLAIIGVQQVVLKEISNKNDICICSYPIDASNGTQRCVTCNKKLSLKSLVEIAARPSVNLLNINKH